MREKVFVVVADNSRIHERWQEIAREGRLPLGGWFPQDLEVEVGMLLLADSVRVYVVDDVMTEGMRTRIAVARALGKDIEYVDDE